MVERLSRITEIARIRTMREIFYGELGPRATPIRRVGHRGTFRLRPQTITIVYDWKREEWRASNTIIRGVRLDANDRPTTMRATVYYPWPRLSLAPKWVHAAIRECRPAS